VEHGVAAGDRGVPALVPGEQLDDAPAGDVAGPAGPFAAERAAVVLSVVAGVQVMRQMIGLSPLAKAEPEALVGILAPVFQQLVDG
jgi:hypothetical protein